MPPRGLQPRQSGSAHLARPKTSPSLKNNKRGNSIQAAISFDDYAIPEEDEEEEQFELLEYEWPDLPPIPSMKDAVSRKRVSQGISYLLPVDKGRNSINSRFRTDLRAMFQEPYASDDLQYDDNRVKLSAAVHFLSNTADTKWTNQHLTSIEAKLNAESENVRKLYVHSAPTGGVASRRMGIDPNKLRKRSNLYLPVKASKAQISPEIVKLRDEATQIIKQGLSYNDDDENDAKNTNNFKNTENYYTINNDNNNYSNNKDLNTTQTLNGTTTTGGHVEDQKKALRKDSNAMLTTYGGSNLQGSMGTSALNSKLQSVKIKQEKFTSYEDLKNAAPSKPTIPQEFRSPFMSDDENQRVWEWLHFGESMSDFEFFLSVCG